MSGLWTAESLEQAPDTAAPGVSACSDDTAPAAPRTAEQLAAELDDLEDDLGYDITTWLPRAEEIERSAESLGVVELVLRARVVKADVWLRQGEILAATPVFWNVHDWATEQSHRYLLTRSNLMLSRTSRYLGDIAATLDHCVAAVESLDDATPPHRRVYYLIALASALGYAGSVDAARERFLQAEQLAAEVGDVARQLLCLNNFADQECAAGNIESAAAVVERMQILAAADGRGLGAASAYLDTIATVQIALGRYAEAELTARAAIDDYYEKGYDEPDALADYWLTLATVQRRLKATDAAQRSLDRCRELCEERQLGELRVRSMKEQAELYAARGDLDRAFETHKAFHDADKELISQQREARARIRHAMFETTEARREAERFRVEANSDPLTGLQNRRYVDERLPHLVEHSIATATPLVVALVDLDHFKRINDQCSHQVGDEVLVVVAGLLAASAALEGGFAARMGGEEFLLVLTGTSVSDALGRLEDLRRSIEGHPWHPLTGGLPVTVSIGVTAAEPSGIRAGGEEAGEMRSADSQASLLARADASLYIAKHEGRNRVCVDDDVHLAGRRHYRDN
jgi:diguanylate cyclase (GGDEF)-like protein